MVEIIESKKNESLLKSISLSVLLVIAFFFSALRGSTSSYSMYLSLGLLFAWIFIAFLSNSKAFIQAISTRQAKAFGIFLLFYFSTAIFVAGYLYTAKLIGTSLIIFSPMIVFSYYKSFNLKKLKLIVIVSMFFECYFIIKSYLFYSEYIDAARRLASNKEVFGDVAIGGGYALAYGLTILTIYYFDLLNNRIIKKIKIKIFIFVVNILMIILVLKTQSTLTIIWLFIGIAISFISRNRSNIENSLDNRMFSKKYMLMTFKIFLLLLFAFIIIFFYKDIGLLIIKYTENSSNVVSIRLREIGYSMALGLGNSDYLTMRLVIPLQSMSSFFQNIFLGQGYEYGYVFNEMYSYIGGHGEWADLLGSMGLVGSIPMFLLYIFAIKDERKLSGAYIPATYIWIFVLLGIFNPLRAFQPMFILLFAIPTFSLLLFGSNYDGNNN